MIRRTALSLTLLALLASCANTGVLLPLAPTSGANPIQAAASKVPAPAEPALLKAATDWIKAHSGDDPDPQKNGKYFPHIVDSGNMGLRAFALGEAPGVWLFELAKAWYPKAPDNQPFIRMRFDPKRHVMFAVETSWDEPTVFPVLFDRATNRYSVMVEMNLADSPELAPADFAHFFPKAKQANADYWDLFDAFFKKAGFKLELGNKEWK